MRLRIPALARLEREDRNDVSLRRILRDDWQRAVAKQSWRALLNEDATPPAGQRVLVQS